MTVSSDWKSTAFVSKTTPPPEAESAWPVPPKSRIQAAATAAMITTTAMTSPIRFCFVNGIAFLSFALIVRFAKGFFHHKTVKSGLNYRKVRLGTGEEWLPMVEFDGIIVDKKGASWYNINGHITDGSGVNHREYGLTAAFAAVTVDLWVLPQINVPTVWAK